MQSLFETFLIDADGDKIKVDEAQSTKEIIDTMSKMLGVSKNRGRKILLELQKDYSVYAKRNQIILARGKEVIYNFETYGMTWYNGHKYNNLNEWDFRAFCEGRKTRTEKKKPKPKAITVTATETQIKRAKQLYFALSVGFNISYKDYQKYYLL